MPTIPNENDVLFGRGTASNVNPGNQRFRSLVGAQNKNFSEEKVRKKKRAIAINIIDTIYGLQPPGRFLTEDRSQSSKGRKGKGDADRKGAGDVGNNVHPSILSKEWVVVEAEKALDKVMHRLREKKEGGQNPTLVTGSGTQSSGDEESEESIKVAVAEPSPINSTSSVGELMNLPSLTDPIEKSQASADLINSVPKLADQYCAETDQANEPEIPPFDTITLSTQKLVDPEAKAQEGSMLDEEVNTFLHDFSARNDLDETRELRELTLKKWMEKSKLKPGASGNVSEYIRSALPIALKLTECLIEAETDEKNGRGNPIPLSSIATANVLIQAKECVPIEETAVGHVRDVIQHAWIKSCAGEDSRVSPRLFALGVVLYELFSPHPFLQEDKPTFDATSNLLSMNSVDLNNESNINHRPSKKSQRQFLISDGNILQCAARLESNGAPSSISALIGNLLDNGELSRDEAYKSFADLRLDLQLMMDDPSRFLDNIEADPTQPISIRHKLYGREDEMNSLEDSYRLQINGKCNGVIIKGGAGEGKSALAMHVQALTSQSNGYFSVAKFDQKQNDVVPLSTISASFNSLCDLFVQDVTPTQLKLVEDALDAALANRAGLLASVVPSLKKLMPSCTMDETSSSCVDSAASMRYLFGKLVLTLSSHLRPISIVFDDVQWADPASLLLIWALMSNAAGCSSVFFTFLYRDDELSKSEPFAAWLRSISVFSLGVIELKGMSSDSVNNLLSDSLHLSPRISRPLASVLHHKTRGNPLFLRQLVESLKEQGNIYVDLSRHRWSWDLNKIMDMEISENVLALLVKEMQGLSTDLQLGLKVASCWGSCVKYLIVDILSKELKVDLVGILHQVSKRGFMTNISDTAMFRFTHDKIEQAAYELMPDQQRRQYHMRFGLALFANELTNRYGNDELFFSAINQANSAGPSAAYKPGKKIIISGLNLKAGRRAIDLSDYRTSFKLFQHGISFLGDGHWVDHYQLSLNLFNAAAEAACVINNRDAVTIYSEQVFAHAKCYDDKLNCKHCCFHVINFCWILFSYTAAK